MELSTDQNAFDKLSKEADPVRRALRRALYPNVQQSPHTERFQTTGSSFDPAKLPVAEICAASFKRYRVTEQLDRRGRPVLLIACDGSASLDAKQMRLTKLLAMAWLQSTIGSRIQVLSGLYHSGEVRDNQTGPLVQWMAHPHKTAATSPADAARAVVTLPDNGTGIQSDALSITFMVEEARKVARGSTIYLILVSDCAWNPCFHDGRDGVEEVDLCLAGIREELGDRLHITLVALGLDDDDDTGVDERVDKVIKVPGAHLQDPAKVAEHVGEYVANCMRERRRYAIRN